MIAIVNYHMGNLRSVEKAFHRIGIKAIITSDSSVIAEAEKLILPGVGHFAAGMGELHQLGLLEILHHEVVEKKKPILGICLGMQLLGRHSEEGDVAGLGWLDAETIRFPSGNKAFRVPHIGWNSLNKTKDSPIFTGVKDSGGYYFVHSFYVRANDPACVAATTTYGIDFVSSVQQGNIYGTQFHPEKSHGAGLALLKNFALHA